MKRIIQWSVVLCVMIFLFSAAAWAEEPQEIDNARASWMGTEQISGLKAESREEGTLLSWNRLDIADGYLIGALQNGNAYKQIGYTTDTTFLDTNASYADYSFYWVFPYKKINGRVIPGRISQSYVYGVRRLPKVTGLKVVTAPYGVRFIWNEVEGADGYGILCRRGQTGPASLLLHYQFPDYTDDEAPVDTISFYWVYAYKLDKYHNKRPGMASDYVYGKAQNAPRTPGPGTYMMIGHYEQDGNLQNGPEDIYWKVLAYENGQVLLISERTLEAVPYNNEMAEVTWENSTIRKWLNNDFYNNAFDEQEKNDIITSYVVNNDNAVYGSKGGNNTYDKVYLLSKEELAVYSDFVENRWRAVPTEYVKNLQIIDSWWLRTPGENNDRAVCVVQGSAYDPGYFVNSKYLVRPVILFDY